MSVVAFTFGSFGDIATILTLINSVVDILNSSGESSAEIKNLVQYLGGFRSAMTLLQEAILEDPSDDSAAKGDGTHVHFSNSALNALKGAIGESKRLMVQFEAVLAIYIQKNGDNGSHSRFWVVWSAFRWSSSVRNHAIELRNALGAQAQIINLILSASKYATDSQKVLAQARIASVPVSGGGAESLAVVPWHSRAPSAPPTATSSSETLVRRSRSQATPFKLAVAGDDVETLAVTRHSRALSAAAITTSGSETLVHAPQVEALPTTRPISPSFVKPTVNPQPYPENYGDPEMITRLYSYIYDHDFDVFFKQGDPFIQGIVEKAEKFRLSQDSLNNPYGIESLIQLALYQIVLYCDDSGSMASGSPTRYEIQCELVERIARICTKFAPYGSGVHLRYINSLSTIQSTADEIKAVMKTHGTRPGGGTPLGRSLHYKILKSLVYDVLARGRSLERPLLIFVITDGCPDASDNPTFKDAIIECKGFLDSKGYNPTAVRYLTGQIGDDESAATFMRDLVNDVQLYDVLHCVTVSNTLDSMFKQLKSDERELDKWLLRLLTTSVVNSVKEVVSEDDVKEGAMKAYYNTGSTGKYPPSIDPEEKKAEDDVAKLIGKPANITEMKKGLDLYVKDSGLEKFFKPGDPFIQTIAEKAYKLSKDPNAALNTPDGIKRLTQLTFYQSVIYCDDSGSMSSDSPTRYITQCDLVERIARIATMLAPDGSGVHLRFINNVSDNKPTAASEIMAVMKSHRPSGGTALGSSLYRKILKPLVYDVIATGKPLAQPLLICVITDGCPNSNDDPTFKNAITECKKFLDDKEYDPTAVRYIINQIGEDASAAAFLRELTNDPQLSDVLYCTMQSNSLDAEFKALRNNEKELDRWLLKTLTAPLVDTD